MPPFPLAPTTTRARLEDIRVRDLMTPNPASVRHGIPVREAAAFLAGRGVGAALVVNDAGRPVGVISQSDVLLAVEAGVDGAPVREVMSPAVIAVEPDADALQAAVVMIRCMVRRVFVVDEDGTPVGVVSTTDLLRTLKTIWAGPTAGRRRPEPHRPAPEHQPHGELAP
ncbi:CBS domain-containing protein [bacterium]|nr:CBS domain-containing protein [bacterium]